MWGLTLYLERMCYDQFITESQKQSFNALQADCGHFKINVSVQKDIVV